MGTEYLTPTRSSSPDCWVAILTTPCQPTIFTNMRTQNFIYITSSHILNLHYNPEPVNLYCTDQKWGLWWRSWLMHCATSQKVVGSIPDGVIGIFHLTRSFWPHHGPGVDSASNRNEYQEYFLGGKGGRCVGLTTLPPSCADCLEIWEPQPPGTLRGCGGLSWDCFTFTDQK